MADREHAEASPGSLASANPSPWWRGARGEWYVAAQVVLIAIVFLGPRRLPGLPEWPASHSRAWVVAGGVLVLAGSVFFVAGLLRLGSNLTPLPHPTENATLVRSGPYRVVRHPIYAGGLALSFGWALLVQGWLTFAYATLLFLFLEIKANREERWLVERFPDYPDYQRRVRKLIPFVH